MAAGDPRARRIYETIGVYFGYNIAHYADFYEIRNLLVLGRVMSGPGGDLILATAGRFCRRSSPNWPSGSASIFPARRRNATGKPSPRPACPPFKNKRRNMQFHNSNTDFFVPDGASPEAALARTTHLCIAAHQDDIEIMAYHGIAECFGQSRQMVQRAWW